MRNTFHLLGKWKSIAVDIFPLAVGQVVSKFAGFLLAVYIARNMGKDIFAIFALGQAALMYTFTGTDLGVRLISVRLIAKDPKLLPTVAKLVLRRRLLLGIVSVFLTVFYGIFGPLPEDARCFVVSFSTIALCYALSIDWAAWALRSYFNMAVWQMLPTVVILLITIGAHSIFDIDLAAIVTGGFIGYGLVVFLSWDFFRKHNYDSTDTAMNGLDKVHSEISWRNTSFIGSASILILLFTNLDLFMLAAISSKEQLALYNAAYKIIFLFFGFYYLFAQVMYPRLSKLGTLGSVYRKGLIFNILVIVLLLGLLISITLHLFGLKVITFIFSEAYNGALPAFSILILCIPLDFAISYIGTLFNATGMYFYNAAALSVAVLSNFVLNLFLIPRFAALGAALSTFIGYLILLLLLLFIIRHMVYKDIKT